MQTITSAETSVNTINRIYKLLGNLKPKYFKTILDYGCGKYNSNKEYAESCGFEWHGYDPYNRTEEENRETKNWLKSNRPSYVVCSNVLNVINDDKEMESVIEAISKIGSVTFFTIYEGDKSGIGKETTKGYQRNLRAKEYKEILSKYFDTVTGRGNIITCI